MSLPSNLRQPRAGETGANYVRVCNEHVEINHGEVRASSAAHRVENETGARREKM